MIASSSYAGADDVVLRPRYQVGDRYALSLSLDTKTRVDVRGAARDSFREDVELSYAAQVEVLETDAAGLPLRERHEGVELDSARAMETSELFVKGAVFELTRRADSSVEIHFRGARVEPRIEKIVGDLLAHQTEYAIAALLDPGRPVAIGERWELEPARVEEFLRTRGIRAVALDGAASVELAKGESEGLVLRYRIPIRRFAIPELPDGASSSDSKGRLEGEVQLDGGGFHRARAHTSELRLDIKGALRAPGSSRAARWHLSRAQSVDQHTETLKDQLASSR